MSELSNDDKARTMADAFKPLADAARTLARKHQITDVQAIANSLSDDYLQELLMVIVERLPYDGYLNDAHEAIIEKYNDWISSSI